VLAAVSLQVVGNESSQASLFMNLDDGSPNPPTSRTVVFTESGSLDINLASSALGDGYHGEGVTCAPLDCVNANCPPQVDVRNHTFTNDTSLPASSLHVRFSGGITPTLVQNAPGCPAPTISGDHSAGRLDVDWGTLCVDAGETAVIEVRSWPIAVPTCSHWAILGNATLKDCDRPPLP
jgi:hypothetical protein